MHYLGNLVIESAVDKTRITVRSIVLREKTAMVSREQISNDVMYLRLRSPQAEFGTFFMEHIKRSENLDLLSRSHSIGIHERMPIIIPHRTTDRIACIG